MINEILSHLVSGNALSEEHVSQIVESIARQEVKESQLGALLACLSLRGEESQEIAWFARHLYEHSIKIKPEVSGTLIDTCGTGGDRTKTFNVSTIASFVVSAAGCNVAKHGNRSATGKSGSADLLEELGYNLNASPELVKNSIERVGIGFLFAPNFHPVMKNVSKVRKELGIKTIFNLLGPLINPANPDAQLIGVPSEKFVIKICESLQRLGKKRALVVSSADGMDEISTYSNTHAAYLNDGVIKRMTIRPEDIGIKRESEIPRQVESPKESAMIAVKVLKRPEENKNEASLVIANAAAAIFIAGKASSLKEARQIAEESLYNGRSFEKLRQMVKYSKGNMERFEYYEREYDK